MKTRLTTLALVVLTTTLGSACDPEGASLPEELEFREDIIPPTITTGVAFKVKGGHDPYAIESEILQLGYREAPSEFKELFFAAALAQARVAFEDEFLAEERNIDECQVQCDDLEMSWNDGVNVFELRLEHDDVRNELDEEGALYWEANAYAEARVGCACE